MPASVDKIIISDTACLIGLTNIGQIDILRKMYGEIIVTREVAQEYGSPLPDWIEVREISDVSKTVFSKLLEIGEASAIALAMQTENAMLIVDDKRARQFALGLGIEITGTLGVLIQAYESGVLQGIEAIVAGLRKIGFRLLANTEALIGEIKKQA